MKNVGRWAHRLDPQQGNPREVAFAEQWEDENTRSGYAQLADQLLYGHGHGITSVCSDGCENYPDLPQDFCDRDRQVAATIIRWLGSNIGFAFLEDALKRCGYRIVKVDK